MTWTDSPPPRAQLRNDWREGPARRRVSPGTNPTPVLKPQRTLRPDIQGLRAIAILLVVLYHCDVPGVPGGYIGVDVFFVISGFLITGHLAKEADTGRLNIARFYGRRLVRLLPAATLVIGATIAASWYWAPATRARSLSWDALSANLYWINYRLIETGTEYRNADAAPSPLQHFWSLAVEEQFYLVIPLLVLITAVAFKSRVALAAGIGAIVGASLFWSVLSSTSDPTSAYFGIATRAWELGAGALLALWAHSLKNLPPVSLIVLRYLGIAAIAYAAITFTEATPFPSYNALVPVLGAVAVIAGGSRTPEDPLLGNQAFLVIGARSYSWYLWHWPVLMIAPYAIGQTLNLGLKLAAVALAFLLAAVTYELFEHPMQLNKELRDHPRSAFKFGAMLTAIICLGALALPYLPDRQPLGVGTVAELTLAGNASAQEKKLMAQVEAATKVDGLPSNLTPNLTDAPTSWPQTYNDCHLAFKPTRTPKKCERYGDPNGSKLIVLYGDSHAAQWFPALNKIGKEKHWRLANFTKSACSAASITMYLPANKGAYTECDTWRRRALARMDAIKPDLIVMASNWGGYANGLDNNDPGTDPIWLDAYGTTMARLYGTGARVVYMNDTPWPKEVIPDCLAIHPRDIQQCGRTLKSANSNPRRQKIITQMKGDEIPVIDPTPWFCTVRQCPPVIGNYLVYMDGSHVTPDYGILLAPVLAEKLPDF